jgi:hypothetical protein
MEYKAGMGALKLLCALAAAAALGSLAACGSPDCEQDLLPPQTIAASSNPHRIQYLSSDLGIARVRWHNVTTGTSGFATLQRVNQCVGQPFFPICGDWTEVTMDVPLVPGLNNVQTFTHSDGCEWRDDYAITLT